MKHAQVIVSALAAFLVAGCLEKPSATGQVSGDADTKRGDSSVLDAGADFKSEVVDDLGEKSDVHELLGDLPESDCVGMCEGKSCGDNGCGKSCGQCDEGEKCLASGQCGSYCDWLCESVDRQCGTTGPPDNCYCGECDDKNFCTDDSCDGQGHCQYMANAKPCDDGNPCTLEDVCAEEVCAGDPLDCNDDNPCTDDECVNGKCLWGHNAAPCDDGDACTELDKCSKGDCQPGEPKNCDDGNDCTKDSCDPSEGCLHEPLTETECNDGNPCTEPDKCIEGTCTGDLLSRDKVTVEACICATDADCEQLDDNNNCNGTLECVEESGTCGVSPGSPLKCDDGFACTADSCDSAAGCLHAPDDALCNDENPCTDDSCDLLQGCVNTPNDDLCDDGDACTVGDQCAQGQCSTGPDAPDCNDGNECTQDSCVPLQGCVHAKLDQQACNDGDACTITDVCQNGACTGSGNLDCDDGEVCTDDSCGAVSGCLHTANAKPCDDGNVCTLADNCVAGKCIGGNWDPCNDGNVCTDDSCDAAAKGCVNIPNSALCDDGDVCTLADLCSGGVCSGEGELTCDDGNECTDDGCLPASGCSHTAVQDGTAPCENNALAACLEGVCCHPACDGKECGDDGCSGSCGACPVGFSCGAAGGCAWDGKLCGEGDCPPLAGYSVTCNPQLHCEYSNQDTSGWKKWDVWIHMPPGTFTMGSPDNEVEHQLDEEPQHPVTIKRGFLVGKYEAVVGQYEACMAGGVCTAPSTVDWDETGWGTNASANHGFTHPQNGLTWQQAKDFCAWVAPGGRLPSEAEWEYTAKGPVHVKYPWGDVPEPTCSNDTAVFNEAGGGIAGFGCGTGGTFAVGLKPAGASWSGALDMAGNVFEWCEDWYHSDYKGAPVDGAAWVDAGSERVNRGGAFGSLSYDMRSAHRHGNTPGLRVSTMGARCVRPMPASKCGEVECRPLDGYFVTCNAQDHCEYYNQDTTGWRKWDVWIYLPPGTFTMGSPDDEVGHQPDEEPQHSVVFKNGFLVAKHEAVVAQYEACMAVDPVNCPPPGTSNWPLTQGTNTSENGKSEHPQNGLTWQQAQDFCRWTAPGGRLPSEAEWEYVAPG